MCGTHVCHVVATTSVMSFVIVMFKKHFCRLHSQPSMNVCEVCPLMPRLHDVYVHHIKHSNLGVTCYMTQGTLPPPFDTISNSITRTTILQCSMVALELHESHAHNFLFFFINIQYVSSPQIHLDIFFTKSSCPFNSAA